MAFRAMGTWWRVLLPGGRASVLAAGVAGQCIGCRRWAKADEADEGSGDLPECSDLREHHLSSWRLGSIAPPLDENRVNRFLNPIAQKYPAMLFRRPNEKVKGDVIENSTFTVASSTCVRSQPCRRIWFNRAEVKVGLVTCGGLCPGLNSIIREVTNSLWFDYGIHEIYGFSAGFNGLSDPDHFPPLHLTNESVRLIHTMGGSVLKAGRGGFDPFKICENLKARGINVLFLIGGDGTQWAGDVLFQTARQLGYDISIVGIPKSIDNDVLFFDRTFGFDTAVREASAVVKNGWVEAASCDNGVGIVKLMGRDSGFVAMNACLASTIGDACIIPELQWKLPDLLEHIDKTLTRKKFAVIVVAEGAGQDLISTGQKDATGHTIYGDIGLFLKKAIGDHVKEYGGRVFYIDPSYIIRSVAVAPIDHIYCTRLAHDAVHTAMRGYTGVCVGGFNGYIGMVPSKFLASGTRRVCLQGTPWQSCVAVTKMPASLAGFDQARQEPTRRRVRGSPDDFRHT